MSEILEILATEATQLLHHYANLANQKGNRNNCFLFNNMPFTNVEILCDFACHKNPLYFIEENCVAVVSTFHL